MLSPEDRLSYIIECIDRWLANDNHHLQRAIEQTVEKGFFSFEDVRHSLRALNQVLTRDALVKWAEKAGLFEHEGREENVLCLHAGNIPLAGFQNALATLISGAKYIGKISKKDPFLLPTFLNEVKKTDPWSGRDIQWVHELDDLHLMLCDRVLFSGSERTVPKVIQKIRDLKMEKPETRYLICTAHFSMAYLDSFDNQTIEHLTEAILRYGGKGCRSVAVVVSPQNLNKMSDKLEEKARDFWQHNPQQETPGGYLDHRFAYNESVQRTQLWLKDFLYQEGGFEFDYDFILYWKEGGEEVAASLANEWSDQLQSIYIPESSEARINGWNDRVEPLNSAQKPPVDWTPDGVDTLKWLLSPTKQ